MGRAAQYTEAAILDAALDLVAQDGAGAATAVAIAARLGAPSGSIYHRFASRDLILATLWVRTVKRFQRGYLDAISGEDTHLAAANAVTHTLEWATTHPSEAVVLTWYRREDLIARWPDELGDELSTLNDGVGSALKAFTVRHFGVANAETLGKAQLALVELPYAAARQAIRRRATPAWLTESVVAATHAVLGPGLAALPDGRAVDNVR